MTAFVVVNPKAGHTARDWPRIKTALESIFPLMTVAQSHGRGEIARLVRTALKDGHLDVIAVGGDGTINEAVNGFFENGAPLSPDAVFGFVSCGRRSDFRRTFGIKPGPEAGIARLKQARVHRMDVGHVACLSLKGEPVSRFFVNAASLGFFATRAGRSLLGSLLASLSWRPPHVRLFTDAGYDEIAGITNVVVANGRWFDGARLAPEAQPGDGLFDIVVMGGRRQAWRTPRDDRRPPERRVRAARLTAAPTVDTHGAVYVETDGESAGVLPAKFEILPAALNLRC